MPENFPHPDGYEKATTAAANMGGRQMDRREALKMVGLFGALLLQACKGKDEPRAKASPSRPETADEDVELPEFSFSDEPMKLPKTDIAACKVIAQNVIRGVQEFLIPEIKKNPQQAHEIMRVFIIQTAQLISTFSPATNAEMETFHKNWDNQVESLVREINKYLVTAGVFMDVDIIGDEKMRIEIHEIEKTAQVTVSHGRRSLNVPILFLKSGMVVPEENKAGGELGALSPDFETFHLYKEKLDPTFDALAKNPQKRGNFSASPMDREEFLNDVFRHESTHALMAAMFPVVAKERRKDRVFEIPLKVELQGTEFGIDLSGAYPPAMLQELCGVGVMIAASPKNARHYIFGYLHSGIGAKDSYHLVRMLLPLAILKVSQNSPKKAALMHKILTEGITDDEEMKEFISGEPFTDKDAKKAGMFLYKVGYTLLKRAEKGDFKKFTQP